jgi:hypothetical protein
MTKIAIVPNAAGTGTFTIEAPNSNSNRTLVLPDAAGSVVVNEGSGAFKIDSAGNVGIGTTSPAQALEVSGVDARIRNTATNFTISNLNSLIEFNGSDGRAGFIGPLSGDMTFRTDTAKAIVFQTNGASERARLDASGRLLVGTTSTDMAGSSQGAVVSVGTTGVINARNNSVANSGTLDITINSGGGGFAGLLVVQNTQVSDAGLRTQSTFSVIGRGTDAAATQIATRNGASGGRSFTVTFPSNGVVRITNTSGATTSISASFFGNQGF